MDFIETTVWIQTCCKDCDVWCTFFSVCFLSVLPLSLFMWLSDHCFIHKWLLLTDPEDPSAGAKGYLKISINVIGPGDDPKPSPSTLAQDDVDIESWVCVGVCVGVGAMCYCKAILKGGGHEKIILFFASIWSLCGLEHPQFKNIPNFLKFFLTSSFWDIGPFFCTVLQAIESFVLWWNVGVALCDVIGGTGQKKAQLKYREHCFYSANMCSSRVF